MATWRGVLRSAQQRGALAAVASGGSLGVLIGAVAGAAACLGASAAGQPIDWRLAAASAAAGSAVGAAIKWAKRSSPLALAAAIDRSAGLHDAVGSALLLSTRDEPTAAERLAMEHADRASALADLARAVPWNARLWGGRVIAAAAALGLAYSAPPRWGAGVLQIAERLIGTSVPNPNVAAARDQLAAAEELVAAVAQKPAESGADPRGSSASPGPFAEVQKQLEQGAISPRQAQQRAAAEVQRAAERLEQDAKEYREARDLLRDSLVKAGADQPASGDALVEALRRGDLDSAAAEAERLAGGERAMSSNERMRLAEQLKALALGMRTASSEDTTEGVSVEAARSEVASGEPTRASSAGNNTTDPRSGDQAQGPGASASPPTATAKGHATAPAAGNTRSRTQVRSISESIKRLSERLKEQAKTPDGDASPPAAGQSTTARSEQVADRPTQDQTVDADSPPDSSRADRGTDRRGALQEDQQGGGRDGTRSKPQAAPRSESQATPEREDQGTRGSSKSAPSKEAPSTREQGGPGEKVGTPDAGAPRQGEAGGRDRGTVSDQRAARQHGSGVSETTERATESSGGEEGKPSNPARQEGAAQGERAAEPKRQSSTGAAGRDRRETGTAQATGSSADRSRPADQQRAGESVGPLSPTPAGDRALDRVPESKEGGEATNRPTEGGPSSGSSPDRDTPARSKSGKSGQSTQPSNGPDQRNRPAAEPPRGGVEQSPSGATAGEGDQNQVSPRDSGRGEKQQQAKGTSSPTERGRPRETAVPTAQPDFNAQPLPQGSPGELREPPPQPAMPNSKDDGGARQSVPPTSKEGGSPAEQAGERDLRNERPTADSSRAAGASNVPGSTPMEGRSTPDEPARVPEAQSLADALRRVAEGGQRAERDSSDAQRLREQAEKMWSQASPQQREQWRQLAQQLARDRSTGQPGAQGIAGRPSVRATGDGGEGGSDEQGGSGTAGERIGGARAAEGRVGTGSERRDAAGPAAPWAQGRVQEIDARRAATEQSGGAQRIIAQWLNDTSKPDRRHGDGGSSVSGVPAVAPPEVGSAVREAQRAAERAVEQRAVPGRLAPVVRKYFERLPAALGIKPAEPVLPPASPPSETPAGRP